MSQAILEMPKIDEEACWNAVQKRDARFNPIFVYSVRSTGIFCRPSCPSRRPRREQVEFFDSPREAQQAGYRACQRCRPLQRNAQMEKVEGGCRFFGPEGDGS